MTTKRTAAAVTAVTAVSGALVAGGIATTAGATPATSAGRTHQVVFHLVGRTAHRTFTGANGDDPRPGDLLTEYASLKRHGRLVGRFMNTCSFVVGGAKTNDDICNGVIEVGKSQIILDGSGNPDVVPVVGGSGRYAFATGYVQDRSTATGATFTVVYRIAGQ